MTTRIALLALVLSAIPACLLGSDDDPNCRGGKCDGNGSGTCEDPRYADGTCQTSLDCAVPDIDCFRTFDDDAEASTWFSAFEQTLATAEGRPPRALLPATDPRYTQARDLLDRGWAAFREHRPVGKLYEKRPALVVVDDPAVNAFVIGEEATGLSVFTVMVHTGLLEVGGTDDALLGIMMHELQHAVGLHLIGNVREEMKKFYVADRGREPIGREQQDDPTTRAAASEWISHAAEIGPYAHAELTGLTISAGVFERVFVQMINAGLQSNPSGCTPVVATINKLRGDIASTDPVSGALQSDLSGIPARTNAAIAALRDDCLGAFPYTLIEVMASTFGVPPEVIAGMLPASDRALIDGRHPVDGLYALTLDRRTRMRAAEADFESATSEPWSAVRYFSTEEDADDVSVPVMRASNLDPAGVSEFLALAVTPAQRTACDIELAADRVPSYGVDLADDHHGTCWRRYHVAAMSERAELAPPRLLAPTTRMRWPRAFADQMSHRTR